MKTLLTKPVSAAYIMEKQKQTICFVLFVSFQQRK